MEYTFTHAEHMTDAEIDYLYTLLKTEGVYDAVFYADIRPDYNEWLDWVNSKKTWFVRVTNERMRTVGIFWLDGFRDMTAYVHYASFRELGSENVLDCGRASLNFMEENLEGSVNVLIGFTLISNRAGTVFNKRLGFKHFTLLEKAVRSSTGGVEDASISFYNFNRGA
jgi:hypothetical protein